MFRAEVMIFMVNNSSQVPFFPEDSDSTRIRKVIRSMKVPSRVTKEIPQKHVVVIIMCESLL